MTINVTLFSAKNISNYQMLLIVRYEDSAQNKVFLFINLFINRVVLSYLLSTLFINYIYISGSNLECLTKVLY